MVSFSLLKVNTTTQQQNHTTRDTQHGTGHCKGTTRLAAFTRCLNFNSTTSSQLQRSFCRKQHFLRHVFYRSQLRFAGHFSPLPQVILLFFPDAGAMGCGGVFFLSQAIILSTAVQQGERFYVTSRFSFRVSLPTTGLWLFDVYLCRMPFDEGSSCRFLINCLLGKLLRLPHERDPLTMGLCIFRPVCL